MGGDVAILGGGTSGGENSSIMVLVRASTAATASALTGEYRVAGITDLPAAGWASVAGTLTSNGTGTMTLGPWWGNADGTGGGVPGGGTTTYNVTANGELTTTSGVSYQGAVSPDGRFAYYAGATTAGDDPALVVLIR